MRRRTLLRGAVGALALPGLAGRATASEHDSFEPLASVDIDGAKEAAVHHGGTVAYVATGDGFVSVDVSDPSRPAVLAERREVSTGDGPLRGVWDLRPWKDRLVVAGPATHGPEGPRGVALFDIGDPAEPRQVAFHATEFHVHNVHFTDGTVYLTGSGLDPEPVVVVDVADDDPREVGRWALTDHDPAWKEIPRYLRPLHDLHVEDGVAYLLYWDAGTWLVDVSDPSAAEVLSIAGGYTPEELAELDGRRQGIEALVPPGNHHYAQVDDDGDLLVVGTEAWAVDVEAETLGGPGAVHLYDVAEKTDPELLATIDAPASFDQTRRGWFTTPHNADLVDGRLYTSWYFGGVSVHDVSDPANPVERAWWRDPREATFWTAQAAVPGEAFVAASTGDIGAELGVDSDLHGARSALYVFPDRAGEQADPPDLTEPPARTPAANETADGGSGDGNATGGTDPGSDGGAGGNVSADDDGAGYGVGAGVLGLGGLGYLLARRRGED